MEHMDISDGLVSTDRTSVTRDLNLGHYTQYLLHIIFAVGIQSAQINARGSIEIGNI